MILSFFDAIFELHVLVAVVIVAAFVRFFFFFEL